MPASQNNQSVNLAKTASGISRSLLLRRMSLILLCALTAACSQTYTVSVNNQAVFDPEDRLARGEVSSADLQGCINLALRQTSISSVEQITALSCANSFIESLDNISQLNNLRFLDLGGNEISDLSPLGSLSKLSGLNLNDNRLNDIAPLLSMPTLVSVSLSGNTDIPCEQVRVLQEKLTQGLQPPSSCRD